MRMPVVRCSWSHLARRSPAVDGVPPPQFEQRFGHGRGLYKHEARTYVAVTSLFMKHHLLPGELEESHR